MKDMTVRHITEVSGTPKDLDEAVLHAICIGPINQVRERSYVVLKDYMAQKFAVAYMKADGNPEALKILEDLYAKLIKRSA